MSDSLEPWMFGTEVTVNGAPVHGHVGRFTLLGRLRMKIRTLRGKPAVSGQAEEKQR